MATQERRWILGGGLASGKSAVRRMLSDAGLATIDADSIGHAVLEADGLAFDAVAERWPQALAQGRVDRQALAQIVFNDPQELAALEAITHPYIFDTIQGQVEEIQGAVVVEMPVVSTAHSDGWRRVVVDSRFEEKLRRAVARGMDEVEARARLANQPSRHEWLALADLVIPNHGSWADLEDAVEMLVDRL